ncbi:hypothetical protein RMN57_13625 [Kitasatospora sp. CM 4170]|uniref:Integral membrane protein n=1 Tax=Kitasatospora aburaviensis TaxID=67265 RepID=A0ABW1ER99_9ACTN|nr:hypothetical protein [Kitasatospora sp. CM 4170]WNM45687.1 hypothetical protein RMN57_13625 [Kitasatospora sp. CM 4170]
MNDTAPADLPAADALRVAEQARAAAQAPRSLPGWFGPVFATAFTLYGAGVGYASYSHAGWLSGLLAVVFAALTGALTAAAARSGGIVQRPASGHRHLMWRAFGQVAGAALVAAGLAYAAGADARGLGVAIGAAAGVAFWVTARWLNARIRREFEAR